jgi:hypothetical protein
LDAHVVLDGHDRLLAAHLAQAPIVALELAALREPSVKSAPQQAAVMEGVAQSLAAAELRVRAADRLARRLRVHDVGSANAVLLDTFTPEPSAERTRAWPLLGGVEKWQDEVRAELARQRIGQSYLLDEPT